jgi:hypothetical protein
MKFISEKVILTGKALKQKNILKDFPVSSKLMEIIFSLFILVVLGIEAKASHRLCKLCTTEPRLLMK